MHLFLLWLFSERYDSRSCVYDRSQQDFSALVNLPPGPHRLKFIVDTQWKTSKNLPSGTDQEGNLINYLQVTKQLDPNIAHSDSQSRFQSPEDAARYWQAEAQWTTEIPAELIAYGEATEAEEAAMDAHDEHNRLRAERGLPPEPMPAHFQYTQQQQHASATPPSLPAQLQKGVLNQSASHPVGSGDDNSILPKPDHTVIDHLAAAPMNKGFLSVGVTKRYRRKVCFSRLRCNFSKILTSSISLLLRFCTVSHFSLRDKQ